MTTTRAAMARAGVTTMVGGDNKGDNNKGGDMLAVSIMMKTIKIKKTLLEVLLRDASG